MKEKNDNNIMMKRVERFVRATARVEMRDEDVMGVREAISEGIDWDEVLRVCRVHDVGGIVYFALKGNGLLEEVQREFAERLREIYYENAVRNMAAEKAIVLLSKAIGRKVVFVKGADLFLSLYPSTGMRPMGDVDILVEREFAEEVWYSLLKHGFRAEEGETIEYRSELHKDVCSHLPKLMTDTFTAEVHWNLFGVVTLYPVTKAAFEKSVQVRDNVYVLPTEMKLIHLCNHFRRHLYEGATLRHLCDINELAVKHGKEIDWEEIDRTVRGTELEGDIRIGMTYAHYFLGTEVPARFLDEEVLKGCELGLGTMFKVEKGAAGVFSYKMRAIPGVWNKTKYVWGIVMPPRRWIAGNYGGGVRGYLRYYGYLFLKAGESLR